LNPDRKAIISAFQKKGGRKGRKTKRGERSTGDIADSSTHYRLFPFHDMFDLIKSKKNRKALLIGEDGIFLQICFAVQVHRPYEYFDRNFHGPSRFEHCFDFASHDHKGSP
jgi:hypothetical protein